MRIGAVVLAAGASRRFGRPKLLVRVDGQPMIVHPVRAALAVGLDPVVVVLGDSGPAILQVLGTADRLRFVHNPEPASGLATSVAIGIAALDADLAGAFFVPADQPWLQHSVLEASVTAFRRSGGRAIVVPIAAGRRGAPVLFPSDLLPELAGLDGDRGGRVLLARHSDRVVEVEVEDPRSLRDVDRPEDLPASGGAPVTSAPGRPKVGPDGASGPDGSRRNESG